MLLAAPLHFLFALLLEQLVFLFQLHVDLLRVVQFFADLVSKASQFLVDFAQLPNRGSLELFVLLPHLLRAVPYFANRKYYQLSEVGNGTYFSALDL